MSSHLCITLRFLDAVPQFHGRGDDGDPEWPPSPLRLFQALVAASATRWRENQFRDYARPALQWLETIQPSIVTAQAAAKSFGYRMYVPNNSGDLMTSAWARGDTETSMAKFRVEKDVRPTRLNGGDFVHYLFPLTGDVCLHLEVLAAAARSITHLGWGIDMVAGNAIILSEKEAADLSGERWSPTVDASADGLRVPIIGTLKDLAGKHTAFLNRLNGDGFIPVPPLTAFNVVGYRRDSDAAPRSVAAFQLLKPDASRFRPFDPVRRTHVVAGMVRHAVKLAAEAAGKDRDWIATFVLGHGDGPKTQARADARFSYLPLPTINPRKVESVRRVLIAEPAGGDGRHVRWAMRALSGADLVLDGSPIGLLSVSPLTDPVVRRYVPLGGAVNWATVSPVVLPGHDEARPDIVQRRRQRAKSDDARRIVTVRAAERTERLLRKAIGQAGFSSELAEHCDLEWRPVGFLPGVDLASRYQMPPYLRGFPRYHVRIVWRTAAGQAVRVPGPIAVGAGRYCGLGLFAACE